MSIALFVIFLIASAFFSGSETAFLSLGRIQFKQIEGMKRLSARRVIALLADPHKLLITILVGNTFVNVAASAVLADFFYNIYGEAGIGISIVTMTVIILIFGEVTPKMFALSNAVNFSFFAAFPLKIAEKLFSPARVVLSNISYVLVRAMGFKISSGRPKITEQEIRYLFSIGKKRGVVKEKEKDMIEGILDFKELNAADIMTPRIDVEALDITNDKDELVRQIKEARSSRFPVYVHTLDNIVGVLHAKDFLLNLAAPMRDLIRKPHFVPESKRIDDLLQELQHKNTHMAVVTDEYGVTSGLVTMEDILEEIVGEIRDEFDFEVPNVRKIDQKNYEIQGLAHIDEVNEEVGLSIETDEVDTIGGYIILCMDKIPQSGDSIEIEGARITVKDVSKNRVTSLLIEKKK